MVVEVAREVRELTGDLAGYLGVLGVSARTYGMWVEAYECGWLAESAAPTASPEDPQLLAELAQQMKDLAHRRHYTFGLSPLWDQYRGRVRRETFRRVARMVREEVKRQKRSQVMRYEFTHPDVAHSIDYSEVPRELPGAGKRYVIKILDECVRLTLRRAITSSKGAGVGTAFVFDHLREARHPYVFKYDREFVVPQFENLLTSNSIVPLPSPGRYPPFNGKTERSNKDMQLWLGVFESDRFWSYDELSQELDHCFERLDEIEGREALGGLTRRQAYEQWERAPVDRAEFFASAVELKRAILQRPGVRADPNDAWRVAAKETLKKFGLVKYGRP